jgi:hypothetical protein
MDAHQYYYSKNGEPAKGPFNLVQLLERVDKDHLIWRNSIDCMTLTDVGELYKFFQVNDCSSSNKGTNNFGTVKSIKVLSIVLKQIDIINEAKGAFKTI